MKEDFSVPFTIGKSIDWKKKIKQSKGCSLSKIQKKKKGLNGINSLYIHFFLIKKRNTTNTSKKGGLLVPKFNSIPQER